MGVSGNSDSVRGASLDAAFERFVAASAPGLLRSAYVLTGDHADADDLLQNALLRTLRHWSSIGTSPVGYAFRVMVNLSHDRRRAQRRRRAGTAQRPSPVGSTYRPFTARVADAVVERLAGELPTAQATAPADEQRRNTLQAALAALPEDDRGNTLLLGAREGLTPKETALAGAPVSETGSRAVALRPGSAAMPSWSWRRLPGTEVRDKADTAHHVEPACVLTAAALLSGVLVAGCGGSSGSPTSTAVGARTSASTAVADAATTTESRTATSEGAPSSGSTAPGAYGSGAPPSDQTLAKLLRIAVCMRQHGISDFPDPRTSGPASFPPGIAEITNFDGAVLLFPQSLNMQAPAYRQALAACDASPLGLPH